MTPDPFIARVAPERNPPVPAPDRPSPSRWLLSHRPTRRRITSALDRVPDQGEGSRWCRTEGLPAHPDSQSCPRIVQYVRHRPTLVILATGPRGGHEPFRREAEVR